MKKSGRFVSLFNQSLSRPQVIMQSIFVFFVLSICFPAVWACREFVNEFSQNKIMTAVNLNQRMEHSYLITTDFFDHLLFVIGIQDISQVTHISLHLDRFTTDRIPIATKIPGNKVRP